VVDHYLRCGALEAVMSRARRLGTGVAASAVALVGTGILASAPASAHGYVDGPMSRSAACAAGLNTNCGSIVFEPQSLEAPKGFPETGPADGQIASAGGLFGGVLDEQSEGRWFKNEVATGPLLMDWKYTAPHSTAKWHYYMTKPGWDPNGPLDRNDLELILEVQHDGSKANSNPDHTLTIPGNRSGYHVILAVWDIADTVNAFYNVVDVDVVGEGIPDTTPPTNTVNLQTTSVSATSVNFTWTESTDDSGVVRYDVYRDGRLVGSSSIAEFSNTGLSPSMDYQFTVVAVDASGNRSIPSDVLTVTTDVASEVDDQAPTAPGYLHSMGKTTQSVSLMWNASDDSSGDVRYQVFRDGLQFANTELTMLMDTNREPGTAYQYLVVAVDETGNRSAASNQLTVTTDAAETTETAPEPETALESQPVESGTWDRFASYTVGDTVTHADSIYEAVQSHTGNGDSNWIYAPSLWVAVTKDSTPHVDQGSAPKAEIQTWSVTGTYAAGDRVSNSGLIYEAVQSHTGNGDPNWIYAPSLWKLI